jgi:hypothetical protein
MKFVWLSLPDYYKAANNFEALVSITIYVQSSFTEVPKAFYIIPLRPIKVFIMPVAWERTILTWKQCI